MDSRDLIPAVPLPQFSCVLLFSFSEWEAVMLPLQTTCLLCESFTTGRSLSQTPEQLLPWTGPTPASALNVSGQAGLKSNFFASFIKSDFHKIIPFGRWTLPISSPDLKDFDRELLDREFHFFLYKSSTYHDIFTVKSSRKKKKKKAQ